MSTIASSKFSVAVLSSTFDPAAVKKLAEEEEKPLEKRSTGDLKSDAMKVVDLALAGMIVGSGRSRSLVAPEADVKVFKTYDEAAPEIKAVVDKAWATALVEFAAKHGTFSSMRYWVRAGEFENGFFVFFALPLLRTESKASLQLALADPISKSIMTGLRTSAMAFMEGQGLELIENRRKFCFPKGLHASGFMEKNREAFRSDFDLIFAGMQAKPKKDKANVWKWAGADKLTYFVNGPAMKEAREAAIKAAAAKAGASSSEVADD